jgi:mannose/cellobiose epimerase-like protein (N-acyl-D-glucosamine 2-epimerase family)
MTEASPDQRAAGATGRPGTRTHRAWLARERERLWVFGHRSVCPDGGFGWLDETGSVLPEKPIEAWITARMTHVAALEVLGGRREAWQVLDHGVRALESTLRDPQHGGWYAAVGPRGPLTTDKRAYEHAFVLLAAASARAAGHDRGSSLLDDASAVFDGHFWREGEGMVAEVWSQDWSTLDGYRGLNANMHAVEAMLAVHDVTGEAVWLDRATRVVERTVRGFARAHEWLLPEHFTSGWRPVLEFNVDTPADPFRPYGATVGHLFEWSRLTVHLRTALGATAPAWLLGDARSLFETAVRVGWTVDGVEGFVYTTDFTGQPVVHTRLHWVVTEAIAAAWALWTATADEGYLQWYSLWWEHADRHFIDREHGSWHHALDQRLQPTTTLWQGKPDIYHAYQAALLPTLGEITSFAGALSRR